MGTGIRDLAIGWQFNHLLENSMTPLTAERLEAYFADPVLLIAEQLVMEDGQPFGDVMASFQRAFFHAVFATTIEGLPAHRLV